jgi:hypothetical protein
VDKHARKLGTSFNEGQENADPVHANLDLRDVAAGYEHVPFVRVSCKDIGISPHYFSLFIN